MIVKHNPIFEIRIGVVPWHLVMAAQLTLQLCGHGYLRQYGTQSSDNESQKKRARCRRHLTGQEVASGIISVRNTGSPYRRRWLGVEARQSFQLQPDGWRPPNWFALDDTRPLALFAGIWKRRTSVRKVKEGKTTNDLFAFLTTDPNAEVGAVHSKEMPVILTTPEEWELWAPPMEALGLQRS